MCALDSNRYANVIELSELTKYSPDIIRPMIKDFWVQGICDRRKTGHKFIYCINDNYLNDVVRDY